jgi:hypothetical protein
MADTNRITLADAIVGQATSTPTADTSRQRTKGMMSKEQQMISSRPSDPEASLPGFVRDHLEAIRETRRPRKMAESPQLDYFQGVDIDAEEDMVDAQAVRMRDSADAQFDYSAKAGKVKNNSLYDMSNKLTKDLMKDFDLTKEQAAAFVGNLAVESMDFKQLQEMKPLVKGSRGGFGFAQWTGDRRVAFEKWAKKNDLDPRSYEANYGYLKKELSSKDPVIGNIGVNTISKLKETNSIEEATTLVSEYYLRPGVPHLDRRQAKSRAVYSMITE